MVKHGISDPRANERKRLRLEGQKIRIEKMASDHSQLFPEFVHVLGGNVPNPYDIKVLDLFAQIPFIHRTYTGVINHPPSFLPISGVQLLKRKGNIWARIYFQNDDNDVRTTISEFRRQRGLNNFTHQVACTDSNSNETWFETVTFPGHGRGIDNAIQNLSKLFHEFGISNILTASGYRFYFCIIPRSLRLPQLAAMYAVAFYLGSITRYKPDVFEKIIEGGYAWIVEEFLANLPMQFLYTLASQLAEVDVVRPYAIID